MYNDDVDRLANQLWWSEFYAMTEEPDFEDMSCLGAVMMVVITGVCVVVGLAATLAFLWFAIQFVMSL